MQAAAAIAKAKKPVAYIGGGVISSNAAEQIREFAELTRDARDPYAHGHRRVPGHPSALARHAGHARNVLCQYGDPQLGPHCRHRARFDDRVTGKVEGFAPEAKIIHIDVDPTSIRKNVRVDIPVVGDVKHVMVELNKELRAVKEPWTRSARGWLKQIDAWRDERPLTYEPSDEVIKPQFVIEKLYELTGGDAIIVTDVGQHQMWAAQFFKYDTPRNCCRPAVSDHGLRSTGGHRREGRPSGQERVQHLRRRQHSDEHPGDRDLDREQHPREGRHSEQPLSRPWCDSGRKAVLRRALFVRDLGSTPDFVKLAEAYGAIGCAR